MKVTFFITLIAAFASSTWFIIEPKDTKEIANNKNHTQSLTTPLQEKIRWDVEFETSKNITHSLSSLKGTPLLVNFFYTECPTICTLQMPHLSVIQQQLQASNKLQDLKFLSITLDPEKDNIDTLLNYQKEKQYLKDNWYFATGDRIDMKKLRVGFNIVSIRNAMDIIDHTSTLFLISEQGQKISVIDYNDLTVELLETELKAKSI